MTELLIVGYQQEEPEAIDEKIRALENDYQTMLTRLRSLDDRTRAGAIIEEFISHALAINVKG